MLKAFPNVYTIGANPINRKLITVAIKLFISVNESLYILFPVKSVCRAISKQSLHFD